MDTVLIFLIVFGIAGGGIWQLYRVSRDTYGNNSPLKVDRVYQISTVSYFTSLDSITSYPLLIMALVILTMPITKGFPVFETKQGLGSLLFISLGSLNTYSAGYFLVFQYNYWKFTEGVILTSIPYSHEIHVNVKGKEIILRKGDIERISIVSNNTRLRFSYYTYYLTNGEKFILTDRMPGLWIINEYFRNIPSEYSVKVFPYIK
ncbi:hypothetical protein [Dyadobacter psychrotolerans]|uniref:Uncharacterized protein n=1 Tax=Dyadobacter psychrotolerans TaxID=2541721 RepID=A0A4R5DKC3_9BACT|nr:hypothetical protein [Dyadobacter psychrotolerans]TDE12450.1 hypothetical protein E0F88_22405 [Dyadobacter psychrotolerans]